MAGATPSIDASTLSAYAKAITDAYPELSIKSLRVHGQQGQYNDVLVINEALIFRFPRYTDGITAMRREVAFLRGVSGRTTLPVPDPIYVSLATDKPGAEFMGYWMLPGEPLWRPAILSQQDGEVLDTWARQLGGFLRELHAISLDGYTASWTVADGHAEWAALYADIREHLFPLMRADARAEVTAHFEAYLDDPGLQRYQPAPRHGDFGSGNMLYDPQTMAITGIIDFGFAAVGDPAVDIAAASTLGEALFGRCAAFYPQMAALLPRARFYRGTYALIEALHGFKNGDRTACDAGRQHYI